MKDKIVGHHPDYDFPLKIIWICQTCYAKRHKRGRKNYINLVEELYRINLQATDETIILIVYLVVGHKPSRGTIQVWKARLRKRGVPIPDRRRKKYGP